MPNIPLDLLDGVSPVAILARLTTSPLRQPYSLDTIPEANFLGYAACPIAIGQQAPLLYGFGFVNGYAEFTYRGSRPLQMTGLYFTAETGHTSQLVHVVPLAGQLGEFLRPGLNQYQFSLAGYAMPQS